jgi:DNA-binding transcriptional LysR family regulator
VDLNQTRVFVEVVRAGGFASAARRLGVPKSTVSARVQALETRLGAQLLKRSTRQLTLTVEGRAYFAQVEEAVDAIVQAEAASAPDAGVLSGLIRFTAPLEFPRDVLSAALISFQSQHPKVKFELLLSNEMVDLVRDNVDLGLRFGDPGGAGLIIRKLGQSRFGFFASPAYVARRGRPRDVADLVAHDRLAYSAADGSRSLLVEGAEGGRPDATIVSNNLALLRELAAGGAGVVALPEPMVEREVKAGRLVRLLDGWEGPPIVMHLVFPSRRDITPRVRAFADHLAARLG